MKEVSFTVVDDPTNDAVYKGAGSGAAVRGETALREVERTFPQLRFNRRSEPDLTALHAYARIDFPVENDVFIVVLSSALTSTGTRLAPVSGERNAPV